jgi:hypothetical protein
MEHIFRIHQYETACHYIILYCNYLYTIIQVIFFQFFIISCTVQFIM